MRFDNCRTGVSLRSMARSMRYSVHRSRQALGIDNHGDFRLVDDWNVIVLGEKYEATVDEIEESSEVVELRCMPSREPVAARRASR